MNWDKVITRDALLLKSNPRFKKMSKEETKVVRDAVQTTNASQVSRRAATRLAVNPPLFPTVIHHVKKGYSTTDGVNVTLSANRLDANPLLFPTLNRHAKKEYSTTGGVNITPPPHRLAANPLLYATLSHL